MSLKNKDVIFLKGKYYKYYDMIRNIFIWLKKVSVNLNVYFLKKYKKKFMMYHLHSGAYLHQWNMWFRIFQNYFITNYIFWDKCKIKSKLLILMV